MLCIIAFHANMSVNTNGYSQVSELLKSLHWIWNVKAADIDAMSIPECIGLQCVTDTAKSLKVFKLCICCVVCVRL